MNLRLQAGQLRLRISAEERLQLLAGAVLALSLPLPPAQSLSCTLKAAPLTQAMVLTTDASAAGLNLTCQVDRAALDDALSLVSEGLRYRYQGIVVLLEVDRGSKSA